MNVSRRELLASMLGAPLAAMLAASGCDKRAAAREYGGQLLGPSMTAGHKLRDARARLLSTSDPVGPVRDVLILGGGPSGLSAAWELGRRGVTDFRVLEMEPSLGGTSVSGASKVTPYPWGAHYLPVPMREHTDLVALLSEMGVVTGAGVDGEPIVAEQFLVREPDERLFYKGFWYPGLYPSAGANARDVAEREQLRSLIGVFAARRDSSGRRAFALPVDESSRELETVELDRVSAAAWLAQHGFTSRRLLWTCEYACRDDFGTTLETTSAWAFVHYYASRARDATSDAQDLITWPEGNGALVRHLGKNLRERVETGRMVVDVREANERVHVTSVDLASGRTLVEQARRVIVALPHFIASRIVSSSVGASNGAVADAIQGRSLQDSFTHGAWLVANLHLRDRPRSRGFAFAWDNVLYDSPSLGYVTATHQRGREFGPTVWTYYMPFTESDARHGRERLLQHNLKDWQHAIVSDLGRAHIGFEEQIEKIDVWRWGHAMVQPRVGTIWGGAREQARQPRGPIHFAHADLSGIALFEEAFHHGLRAAREVATALGKSAA